MADLHYFDGQWFSSEEALGNYLEERYEQHLREGFEHDRDDLRDR